MNRREILHVKKKKETPKHEIQTRFQKTCGLEKTQHAHTVGADTRVECRPETTGLVHSTILLYCQLCHGSPVNDPVHVF